MKLELLNTSIVALAQEFDPSVLHPAYLKAARIVPEAWEHQEQSIVTPIFSIVKYSNGMVFTLETNKFQVLDNNTPLEPEESQIPKVAKAYIKKTAPSTRFTAVGINLMGFIEEANPERFLKDRFLKTDQWGSRTSQPKSVTLRLQYDVLKTVLLITCDVGTVRHTNDVSDRTGIVVSGNYHTDIHTERIMRSITSTINNFPTYYRDFHKRIVALFGLED